MRGQTWIHTHNRSNRVVINYRKQDNGERDTNLAAIHVDDIICKFENQQEATIFETALQETFGKVTINKLEEGSINFTGRSISINEKGNLDITMDKITKKFTKKYNGSATRRCPANTDIFKISNAPEDRQKG